MSDKHGLVIQNETISDVALGTLGARAAIKLGSAFNAITATYLMNRFRLWIHLKGLTTDEGWPFLVGLARGDATAAEIATAMLEGNTSGPSDTTQVLTQDNAFVVVQKSIRQVARSDFADTEGFATIDMKLPKRGIPFSEGSGWQIFIYNATNSALTTGAIVNGQSQYWGVWLRD